MMISYIEIISPEIQTILIAFLNNESALAAQTAFYGIFFFFVMIPDGTSITINTFAGNAVGEGKQKKIVNLLKISFIYMSFFLVIMWIVSFLVKEYFVAALSTDPEMAENFSDIATIYISLLLLVDFY